MSFEKRSCLLSVGASTAVVIPYELIEAEARKAGLPVKEFRDKYQAVAHYNGSDNITYTFEKKD